MKKILYLILYFFISIAICMTVMKILPNMNINIQPDKTQYLNSFEKEILFKEYVNNKNTMLYFLPTVTEKNLSQDQLTPIMLTLSKNYADLIDNMTYKTDSEEAFLIKEKLNIITDNSFAVYLDKNGYVLGIYTVPLDSKKILNDINTSL